MIHVCSLARLHHTVQETGALHVVSLIGDEASVERPSAIVAENHLWLRLHDISAPLDGYVMPEERHIAGGTVVPRWLCIVTRESADQPRAPLPAFARSIRIETRTASRKRCDALRRRRRQISGS
jgi:hypothetical protein